MTRYPFLADAPDHIQRHAAVLTFDHDVTTLLVARPLEFAR